MAQEDARTRDRNGESGEAAALGLQHPESESPGAGEGAIHEMRARHATAAASDALSE